MSNPIRHCELVKALTDDAICDVLADKYTQLIYSILPCTCKPPCRDLFDFEKEYLQKKINDIIEVKRKKRMLEREFTIEDMCKHIAKAIKHKINKDLTPEQVYFNICSQCNTDVAYILEQYEDAVFTLGKDLYGNTALSYFEDRLLLTMNDPKLKILAVRYQKAISAIEKKDNSNVDYYGSSATT